MHGSKFKSHCIFCIIDSGQDLLVHHMQTPTSLYRHLIIRGV